MFSVSIKQSAVRFLSDLARKPGVFRRGMSLWPPYLAAGIRVEHISDDWRVVDVSMGLHKFNTNAVGTQFGGSLYSMCDPFYMLQLMRILGSDYNVWDQTAEIRFVAPGTGRVRAHFEITDDFVDDVLDAAAGGEKVLRWLECEVVDDDDAVIARVRKQIYIRLKREKRPVHA